MKLSEHLLNEVARLEVLLKESNEQLADAEAEIERLRELVNDLRMYP